MSEALKIKPKTEGISLGTHLAFWAFAATAFMSTIGFPILAAAAQLGAVGLNAAGLTSLNLLSMAIHLTWIGKVVHVGGGALSYYLSRFAKPHPYYNWTKERLSAAKDWISQKFDLLIQKAGIADEVNSVSRHIKHAYERAKNAGRAVLNRHGFGLTHENSAAEPALPGTVRPQSAVVPAKSGIVPSIHPSAGNILARSASAKSNSSSSWHMPERALQLKSRATAKPNTAVKTTLAENKAGEPQPALPNLILLTSHARPAQALIFT